jgi:hypothetical protein
MENQIQFSIGWGTLSLIVAGIAQGKNRSGLVWWLLSLLLGPFALLILLMLSKVPESNVIEARVLA